MFKSSWLLLNSVKLFISDIHVTWLCHIYVNTCTDLPQRWWFIPFVEYLAFYWFPVKGILSLPHLSTLYCFWSLKIVSLVKKFEKSQQKLFKHKKIKSTVSSKIYMSDILLLTNTFSISAKPLVQSIKKFKNAKTVLKLKPMFRTICVI